MTNLTSILLEILKITIPALIVFLTVFYLMKNYLEHNYREKLLEFKQMNQSITIPLRLQAYERLSLFCERIYLPNLILRLRTANQTSGALKLALLMTIQQEFEYNITQQVYVSEQLWQIVKISRDDTVQIVNAIFEQMDPKSTSSEFAKRIFLYLENQQVTALDKALIAIKKEASILLA